MLRTKLINKAKPITQKQPIEQNQEQENNWKKAFEYPSIEPELWAAKYGHNMFCVDLR